MDADRVGAELMPLTDAQRVRREATRAFLADADLVDELLEKIAQGEYLKTICEVEGLSYPTVMRWLAQNLPDEYDAAKHVRADTALDDMERIERAIESEDIGFNEGREILKSKQWRAERLNPHRYGQRQQIDMNVTDKTKLHLEALRLLSQRKRTAIQAHAEPAQPAIAHEGSVGPAVPMEIPDAVYVPVVRDTELSSTDK